MISIEEEKQNTYKAASEVILEVEELSVTFRQYDKGLQQKALKVISSLNAKVRQGEILAIVGSSGSGKSLLAHAILGILPQNAEVTGVIKFMGKELDTTRQEKLRGEEIVLVPQSVNFLDPLMRVGRQVRTAVRGKDPIEAQRSVFQRYKLKAEVEKMFPFQLSGGMARRILVSTAMVSGARLVIADEPTPGLDPKIISEALLHFKRLSEEGCGVIFITHDIETALRIADNVAVFYAGTTVEVAPVADFSGDGSSLRHPYSKALWRALPQNEFLPIEGAQPLPNSLPSGCLFQPRCGYATDKCLEKQPEARILRHGMVRCNYAS